MSTPTPKDTPALYAEIDRLKAELASANSLVELLRTGSICAIGAENASVAEYMKHWEARTENAERERDTLKFALEAWQSTFGTSQLSHAQARLERAEKDRDEAQSALREIFDRVPCDMKWMWEHSEDRARWRKAAGMEG